MIYVLGLYFVIFLLWFAATLGLNQTRFLNLVFGPGIALFYLQQAKDLTPKMEGVTERSRARGGKYNPIGRFSTARVIRASYLVGAVLSVAFTVYIEANFDRIRLDAPLLGMTPVDLAVGVLILAIVLHATKVAYGWIIALFSAGTILYGFAGPLLPGIIRHSGMDASEIVFATSIGFSGVYGYIPRIGVTWVAIFIVFAGMAKSLGLLDYMMAIGQEFGSKLATGITHVAVISSFIIGSMTGAAAANAATTGSFTIPLMKEQGIKAEYSSAIESVASSGSQVLPPVMGIAAFLMAEILGIPYVEVIKSAILPALLFFASIFIIIHLMILKHDWTVEPSSTQLDFSIISNGVYFVIPLLVLLYTLVVMRLTPLGAGLYTVLSLVLVNTIWELYDAGLSIRNLKAIGLSYIEGAKEGALEMAPLFGVLGALGMIVSMITQTGLSGKISSQLIGLAGGIFVLLLLFAMITSLLFGLGMPTPAAYILVVFLVAPALFRFGVQGITAHLFVFYFSMLSAITPPVALVCAITSRIGNCDFIGTCIQALRIGAPAFVLPFTFVVNDSLILWKFPTTALVFIAVLVGFLAFGMGIAGHNGVSEMGYAHRLIYIVAALAILVGPKLIMVGALILVVSLILGEHFRRLRIRSSMGDV